MDLVFSDSVRAALEIAKPGANIQSLWLELDVGDIGGLPDIGCRKGVILSMLEGPEGEDAKDSLRAVWEINESALKALAVASAGETVRIWWSDSPAETCGFYFAVSLLENSDALIRSIKLPPYFEEGESIRVHDSLKSLDADMLNMLLPLEQDVSPALRRAIACRWGELVYENAPLRAVVNGRLVSAPGDFYDHTLRKYFADGEFTVAQAIGRALGMCKLGLSDWLYAQRIRHMIEAGELEIVKPDKNFYLTGVRKT